MPADAIRHAQGFRLEISLTRGLLAICTTAVILFIGVNRLAAASARHAMVAAEGDQAAQAGIAVLNQGGNAVDAAVAVSLVLGVTNSGSCGIGGGGFMLIYWARDHRVYALDYREVAPQAASPKLFKRNGNPDEDLARSGPLAVAIPGEIAGLSAALQRFGSRQFKELAAPAIKLARDGFPLSPHMARDINLVAAQIQHDSGFRSLFFTPEGNPLAPGAIAHNPKLAAMIEELGDDPTQNFYRGKTARLLSSYIQSHGGIITADDLARYAPVWRKPIHLGYRGYEIYTMPPPSSGGVVLEMLGMLEPGHLAGLGLNSPAYLAQLTEVMRQGFIDRDQYADPAFVQVPIARLLSRPHLVEARRLALGHRAAPSATVAHDHGTSNFCVVDRAGNVVDVTTTINTIFGAKMIVPDIGLILNNEMDDFTIAPGVPNAFKLMQAEPNEVAPGKRPLSSMSPITAMRGGRPVLVAGGSGGPTIITGVTQIALDTLDLQMEAEAAVSAPRIHHQVQPAAVFIEKAMPPKTTGALAQMGYQIKVVPELGAVNAIRIAPGALDGAFDPRKGGAAIGN